MTLYIIGLGLHDEKDITLKGLEAVRRCSHIYLEDYTSRLACSQSELEKLYGRKILPADRELIETRIEEEIFSKAKEGDAALLIIGDPFSATTHTDIRLRAREAGVTVKVVHNASVLTAIGITGLELYKFGKVTSIPFMNADVSAPVEVLKSNQVSGLHTLFLLDLDPGSQRFMTVAHASAYLMEKGVAPDTLAVGCAGLGSDEPEIFSADLEDIGKKSFSLLPQCLIIPGSLHFVEEDALKLWR